MGAERERNLAPLQPGDLAEAGRRLHALVTELYPICRSITGPGVRQTLAIVGREIPLEIREVPTGTPVFDWRVPREWSIREAWIKDAAGRRIVDVERLNLHVMSYSVPVHKTVSRAELLAHLHSLPEHPDWVPYRTSYYREEWGFCLAHRQVLELADETYEVCIDSTLADGSLTYGECYLPGESDEEFLFSAHVCHPSLANDNLSGIAVAALLARHLAAAPRRYSYRFLFAPGTIGTITWLAQNEDRLRRIRGGLVLALLGDPGKSTYKKSRQADAAIDRAVLQVLAHSGQEYAVRDFEPFGYDERQYGSPGIDLAVGCLMRTPPDLLPEYHSSGDNPALVRPEALADSFSKCLAAVEVLENDRVYVSRNPKCEPQLGRRGLYRSVGGESFRHLERAILWVLNLSDGRHSLVHVAQRSGLPFPMIRQAADALRECGLLADERSSAAPASAKAEPAASPGVEALAACRVMVTGARGFLGSHACQQLLHCGAEVHAVARRLPEAAGSLHWHQADLADLQQTRQAIEAARPDVIFHLAGYSEGLRELEHVSRSLSGDLVTAVNVLTAATQLGCRRVILAGSLEEPDAAQAAALPSSPYAAAKWAASGYARMFHALYRTPAVILRVFMTYGPRQRPRKVIPYTILSLLEGRSPQLSDGRRPVDWIYVDDVIRGMLAAAVAPGVEGSTLDLGSGRLVSVREVVEEIVRQLGAPVAPCFGALPDRPLEQVRAADLRRTTSCLGWTPRTALADGLRQTIDWYREHRE